MFEAQKNLFFLRYKAKKKAFTKYVKKFENNEMDAQIERAKKYCSVIRLLTHTQVEKAKIGQKKAHLKEIQINGGNVADKVGTMSRCLRFGRCVLRGSAGRRREQSGDI